MRELIVSLAINRNNNSIGGREEILLPPDTVNLELEELDIVKVWNLSPDKTKKKLGTH